MPPPASNMAVAAANAASQKSSTQIQNKPSIRRPRTTIDTDYASKRVSQVSTSSSSRRTTQIGPWRLGKTLGRGSSGRVSLAKHTTTGQLAAVKILPKAAYDSADHSPNSGNVLPYGIEKEVIIMKLIRHPNVMSLYDVWENQGELYLVLEYVEGGELFDFLIKNGRMEEPEAMKFFRQIIAGVDYCHKFNICHRDLKPENLLLDKDNNIKIADFGMAALETAGRMLETSCGSPHYAAPEVVSGKPYHGASADIWSCGVILFALLTGHLPFDKENLRELLITVQSGKYIMPNDLSYEAKNLISRILVVDPARRITIQEIYNHPLMTRYQDTDPALTARLARLPSVLCPVRSKNDIDPEILRSLTILWHGASKQVIVEALLEPGANPEKTFYCLLLQYRQENIANRHEKGADGGDEATKRQSTFITRRQSVTSRSSRQISGVAVQRNTPADRAKTPDQISPQDSQYSQSDNTSEEQDEVRKMKRISKNLQSPRGARHIRSPSRVSARRRSRLEVGASQRQIPATASRTRLPTSSSRHTNVTFARRGGRKRDSHLGHSSTQSLANRLGLSQQLDVATAVATDGKNAESAYFVGGLRIPTGFFEEETRRTSDDFAKICERAFYHKTSPKRRSKVIDESMLKPDPTHKGYLDDVISDLISNGMSRSSTMVKDHKSNSMKPIPNFLPMVFEEEDQFADTVERELHSTKQPNRSNVEPSALSPLRRTSHAQRSLSKSSNIIAMNSTAGAENRHKRGSSEVSQLHKTQTYRDIPSADQDLVDMHSRPPPPMAELTDKSRGKPMILADELDKKQMQEGAIKVQKARRKPVLGDKDVNLPVSIDTAAANKDKESGSAKTGTLLPSPPLVSESNAAQPSRKTSIFSKLIRPKSERTASAGSGVDSEHARRSPLLSSGLKFDNAGKRNASEASQTSKNSSSTVDGTAANARNANANNGDRRNWFSKILNNTPETRVVYSVLTREQLQVQIINLLHDWRRYGISGILIDGPKHNVQARISSKNALQVKPVRFKIDLGIVDHTKSSATFTQEKGAASSFIRLVSEIERVLNGSS